MLEETNLFKFQEILTKKVNFLDGFETNLKSFLKCITNLRDQHSKMAPEYETFACVFSQLFNKSFLTEEITKKTAKGIEHQKDSSRKLVF